MNGSSVTGEDVLSMVKAKKRSRKASLVRFQRLLANTEKIEEIATFVCCVNGALELIPGVKLRKHGFSFQEIHDLSFLELHLWTDSGHFQITPLKAEKDEDDFAIHYIFNRQVCYNV